MDVWFRYDRCDPILTESSDTGTRGRRFERALFKAFDLLGMTYQTNTEVGGPLWDVRPTGSGWKRVLKDRNTNIKISGTKWAFSDSALASMLPWEPGSMDPASGPEELRALEDRVKAHLDGRGLAQILWLRPTDQTIEAEIEQAAASRDVAKLDRLLRGNNFLSTDFRGYKVRVTRHSQDKSRVGSVALILGGKVAIRSEAPRVFATNNSHPRVGFRREGKRPSTTPHALRPKSANVKAPGPAQ